MAASRASRIVTLLTPLAGRVITVDPFPGLVLRFPNPARRVKRKTTGRIEERRREYTKNKSNNQYVLVLNKALDDAVDSA
jgi:hypothetical protein